MRNVKYLIPGLAMLLVGGAATVLAKNEKSIWPYAGLNLENTRYQSAEKKIGRNNVGDLIVAWEFDTDGDVSATPAVDSKRIYFPDAGGSLWALDRDDGSVAWKTTMAGDYGLPTGDYARTTPVIAGDLLIFGDQGGKVFNGPTMMAVDKATGELVWQVKVDDHPQAMITQSAVMDQETNTIYVGVSSNEGSRGGNYSRLCVLQLPGKRGRIGCRHRRGNMEDLHRSSRL